MTRPARTDPGPGSLTESVSGTAQEWAGRRLLYLAEGYNGVGCRERGLPSPHVWAATDIYSKGRYGVDGQFNAGLKARNVGVAAALKELVARSLVEL